MPGRLTLCFFSSRVSWRRNQISFTCDGREWPAAAWLLQSPRVPLRPTAACAYGRLATTAAAGAHAGACALNAVNWHPPGRHPLTLSESFSTSRQMPAHRGKRVHAVCHMHPAAMRVYLAMPHAAQQTLAQLLTRQAGHAAGGGQLLVKALGLHDNILHMQHSCQCNDQGSQAVCPVEQLPCSSTV